MSRFISSRRARLASKSKIPPQFPGAAVEVVEAGFDAVEAFCFHGLFRWESGEFYPNAALDSDRERGDRH